MSKKRFDFRLAVGGPMSARSGVWHFWSRNKEVYAAFSGLGGVQKFSFHFPDICRLAFTKEHGTPSAMSQRALHEWRRDLTPPRGTMHVTRVLRVAFATDLLSTALKPTRHEINWIQPAPPGGSTVIDLMFTRDTEEALRSVLPDEAGHRMLVYKTLPNGESYCITRWFSQNGTEMLRVPASHGHPGDLIISPEDPSNTGRPIRFVTFSNPKDGDLINGWEFGGYWSAPVSEHEWKARCDLFRARSALDK